MAPLISATIAAHKSDFEQIRTLIEAGADILRILYWSDEKNQAVVDTIRACSKELGRHPLILMDISSQKIRLGAFQPSSRTIIPHQRYLMVVARSSEDERIIPVDDARFPAYCTCGQRIICGDGDIVFDIHQITSEGIVVSSAMPGTIRYHKGVYIEGMPHHALGGWSKATEQALTAAACLKVDWVALSFVQNHCIIEQSRDWLVKNGGVRIRLMAKIETPTGMENIEQIVISSDGVMVARGDLALYADYARLALHQRKILHTCQQYSKFCLVSTGMFESLESKPIPSRADIIDISLASLDGADGIQFCEETAIGAHPGHVIRTARHILATLDQERAQRG